MIKLLRKLFISLFFRFNPGDIYIKHHYTGARFFLHSFNHKGYWYHGKSREKDTMDLFGRLIKQSDTVIDVGGHIGYISLYFSQLVGSAGHVYVFEPGINNLPYLKKNLSHSTNVTLVNKAVSDTVGELPFYIENITGQNNTLIKDYPVFRENAKCAFLKSEYQEVIVDVIRLDDFIAEEDIKPDFIKIDVEGAELEVIKGMLSCLQTCKPKLMIEITRNLKEVHDILVKNGYVIFNSRLEVKSDHQMMWDNIFCLHQEAHKASLKGLNLTLTNS